MLEPGYLKMLDGLVVLVMKLYFLNNPDLYNLFNLCIPPQKNETPTNSKT